ncbi:MAG: hypothetical protein H6847_03500 [Hyphomonas sp.]|nr:hypothetical protein [Hyphomonas sp.]MCA8903376.1 hypothetical protein [Hyphomonas sp.]MCB9970547.1 hypothetical protein [Hyphomonas sp.]
MIAHVSIPARDPRRTALLLASLIDGEAFNFPVVPGAWIAVARDGSGLAVEVYPETMAHHPGVGEVDSGLVPDGPQAMPWEDQIFSDGPQIRASAFHFAMASPLSDEEILKVAHEAGLRALKCERGGVFAVVEVWLENAILLEVLTPHEVGRYRQFMNPAACAAMFGQGERPSHTV